MSAVKNRVELVTKVATDKRREAHMFWMVSRFVRLNLRTKTEVLALINMWSEKLNMSDWFSARLEELKKLNEERKENG